MKKTTAVNEATFTAVQRLKIPTQYHGLFYQIAIRMSYCNANNLGEATCFRGNETAKSSMFEAARRSGNDYGQLIAPQRSRAATPRHRRGLGRRGVGARSPPQAA